MMSLTCSSQTFGALHACAIPPGCRMVCAPYAAHCGECKTQGGAQPRPLVWDPLDLSGHPVPSQGVMEIVIANDLNGQIFCEFAI